MRQVGTGKASVSEPLLKRRNPEMASKPGQRSRPGIEPGGCPLIGQVVPGVKAARVQSAASAWNVGRQVPILPGPARQWWGRVRGSASSGGNRETLSTVAALPADRLVVVVKHL
jgi:hypothetical protein